MSGINTILMQLADSAVRRDGVKQAFVPMPGGEAAGPMAGAPMDPAMAAGGGAMPPQVDPMAMAAGGADPAAIMAAQGMPVDPSMAAAGGVAVPPAPTPAAAPAPTPDAGKGGKAGKDAKIDEIHNMLTKVLGVLVGKGLLSPAELGSIGGAEDPNLTQAASDTAAAAGVPPEQKLAEELPEPVGVVVEDEEAAPVKQAEQEGSVMAELILSLQGPKCK